MAKLSRFFAGRVCIVTGGTQGIGWATVRALAGHGATVYACGLSRRNLERAEGERVALSRPDLIHLSQCDVTEREAFGGWIDSIYEEAGRVDVLINNAAYVRWADVAEMTVEEAERTMRVAYDGLLYGTKAALPLMQAGGWGQIVTVGSIAGNIYVGGASAAYAAAKAAVEAYTRTLQVELAGTPVKTTLLRLGTVADTDFFRRHVPHTRMPRLLDFLPYTTPPRVAQVIVRAIYHRREIVVHPRYLHLLHALFLVAPGFSRWLAGQGGAGKRQYAAVSRDDRPPGGTRRE